MTIINLTRIPSGPRPIVSGTDAQGAKVEYAITPEEFKAVTGNDPPKGLTFAEWHSAPPGGIGRYVIYGDRQVINPDDTRATYVLPGDVVDERNGYRIGLPDGRALNIQKTDLIDPNDFSTLKDRTQLPLDVLDITATTLTVL